MVKFIVLAAFALLAGASQALASEEAASAAVIGIEVVVELLVVATLVALGAKRLRVPYTVALTVVGIAVGFSHLVHPVLLSKEVVLLLFLPPLLFEGTLAMDLGTLRSKWLEVLVLALPVTLLAVAGVAFPVHWVFGVDLRWCLLLGAILAPTDPVSVIALFKEAGVSKKLATIVEGESCFNDGVGVVLYLIFLGILQGGQATVGDAAQLFGVEVAGGLAIGGVLGYLTYRALVHIDDHLIEVMISLVLAYGVNVISERAHVSGVMAVVAAGLIIGNYGKTFAMSPTTRIALSHFWEAMAFLANSLIFLLMGIAIQSVNLLGGALKVVFVYALLLLGRAALVHGAGWLLARTGRDVPVSWRHLIAWSGLRGSLCVALAIGLPATFPTSEGGARMPTREETITLVSGVVLLSMLIQGLSVKAILKRLGLSRGSEHEDRFEVGVAREVAYAAAGGELERLRRAGWVPGTLGDELSGALRRLKESAHAEVVTLLGTHKDLERLRRDEVSRAVLIAARSAVDEAFQKGEVAEPAAHAVIQELDAQIEADGGPRIVEPEPSAPAPTQAHPESAGRA